MRKEEAVIKEQRTLEATRKKLMGSEGKLGTILKQLGQPIISHNLYGGMYDQRRLNDYDPYGHYSNDEESLPTMSLGEEEEGAPEGWEWSTNPVDADPVSCRQVGWHFDGLSRGMHLEIKYDDLSKVLTLHYKGYLVFEETTGDLTAYVPNDEWEKMIDDLYFVAEPAKYKKEREEREDRKEEIRKAKKGFLERIREKWGV